MMEVDKSLCPHRLVHLDLKRAPLKVSYLEQLFPVISSWGATGLLIEWEDTFPYSGRLAGIGSLRTEACKPEAYTHEDVDRIYSLAEANHLMVIPLVQTFGHLEFLLRHEDWAFLREVHKYPNDLCPSNNESIRTITEMIDQVIQKAPKNLKYFHIGSDEVWNYGTCGMCLDQDKDLLLLNHMCAVLKHIKANHPTVRPIMWDDMLRNLPAKLLVEYGLGDLVDPMVWFYEPAPAFFIHKDIWMKYKEVFKNVWVASAFKGATGSAQTLPIIQHHVSNHEQWINEVQKETTPNVLGIALTGWSRYDHYATLCELLPTALPCLALCLRVWLNQGYDEEVYKQVTANLGYKYVPLLLNPYPRPQAVAAELTFPGWKILVGVEWLANLKGKHLAAVNSDHATTWLNPWHIKHNFTNPMHVQGYVASLFELCKEWDALETYMTNHLSEAYYEPTVDEWLLTYVHTPKLAAKHLLNSGERQLTVGERAHGEIK